jgi:hypothetical protein
MPMHVYEMYAYEIHTHEMQAREVHAYKTQAHEMYALRQTPMRHAYETYGP